jgi:hypothetical protein
MLETSIRKAESEGAIAVEVATAQKPAFLLYKKFGFTQFRADMGEVLLGIDLKKSNRKLKFLSAYD